MQQKRRLEKLTPVIRTRQHRLDQAGQAYQEARMVRQEAELALTHAQEQYLAGLQKLNEERSRSLSPMLLSLERSVDFARQEWGEAFRRFQSAKLAETNRQSILQEAHQDLRAAEKLRERFTEDLLGERNKREQKQDDEWTQGRFFAQKRRGGGP